MNEKTSSSSMRENVLSAIEQGVVKRRSRWSFLLTTWLLIAGICFLICLLLFLSSFVIFTLYQSGAWFAPSFGVGGVGTFFSALPWLIVVPLLVFIFLLELLLRRYSFAYKRPALYTVIAIGFFLLLGSVLIGKSHVHERLMQRAVHHELPLGQPFYEHYGMPRLENVTPGTITQRNVDGFVMETPRQELISVRIVPETHFPLGTTFSMGEMVVVLGRRQGNQVTATGIKKIFQNHQGFPPPPRPGEIK